MPPKQKQAKKGPTYKNPIPPKDLISADIKQPPRQLKSLKYPQTFPQPPKNDKKVTQIFQAWPAQEVIKAHDFGINSQNPFQDQLHQIVVKHLKNQNIIGWKSISEVQGLRVQLKQQQGSEQQNENDSKGALGIQSESEEKEQGPTVVIETYERDQTQVQMQARQKQEAQKLEKAAKDKKKGKKEEVKQQGPLKVRDVKMSDIKVSAYIPQEAIWIGSQLQTIKLRSIVDPYTRQPVWKKIYPQQNGVPQITKSGKYWVKLYYMGQPVKIEVDDRIPINNRIKEMFPTSQKRNEKWTLILTKALIKYMSLAWPKQKISGSGLIIHALTGMITQTMKVNRDELAKFENLLNDGHYTKRDVFVSCYTSKASIPPSNFIKASQVRQLELQQNEVKGQDRRISAQDVPEGSQLFQKEQAIYQGSEPIDPHIIPHYSYLLGDYFTNGQFNMAFSKQRSTKQAKLRLEYNNLSKVNLNNKTREEKLEHRRKKKEIKELLAIQEKKRLDLINEEKRQYQFIKLLNKSLRIHCQFQQKQIILAKKCRLNNLNQPPNYELPQAQTQQKQQIKSMKSFSIIKASKEQSEVNPNIDDFSMIQNVLDPLPRQQSGVWIKDIDFVSCFENVQVIFNPVKYTNKSIERISGTVGETGQTFVFNENKEILVLQKVQLNEEGVQAQDFDVLFGFSYEQSQQAQITKPVCMLQKFNFDQFSVTSNVTKLTNKIDSTLLNLKNQNNVFKIYTMCKTNYCYWVSSNAKFKLMSISEYLEEFQGYKKKTISVEYPALQGKNYFALSRFNIKQGSQENNSVILKINSQNPQLIKSLSYNLVNIPTQSQSYISSEVQGVIRKQRQQKHLALDYTRLSIRPQQQYDLVLEACPAQNTPDGSLEVVALIKNQTLVFDVLEAVEPLKIIDKYKPNKYGLIFRERVYANVFTKQGFLVKICEGEQVQGGSGGDKKAAKKGGKDEPTVEFIQKPLDKKRSIIVRLVKNKQVVYETIGTNWITISNVRIPNVKDKANEEYFLQAYFDLRQWSDACTENQDTVKLCWTVSVFGTDSIALVRDTRQQQKEKQTRKSWEDKEPGRAQRAKKSRRRFLILQKKENGEQLTEEQEQIINAPRLTKKQQLEEDKKNEDKNKKGGKKDDKKAGKQIKKQQVQQKPVQLVFPKSEDNCNYEIRNFLKTLQNFSVKKQIKPQNQQARIRSQEQIRAIKESQKMTDQNRVNKMLRNVERRQTIKLKERDKKDQLVLQLEELTKNFKDSWTKYVSWRNEDLQKDKTKQEKQRAIVDILKQQKPTLTQADLEKILNEYSQINNYNKKLYDVGIMLKKNIKINALTEKISGHLTGWEVEQLKAINEQIKNESIEGISENVLKDMKTMLQEAQKNPAMVVQKQNQAKKAKKGGKK